MKKILPIVLAPLVVLLLVSSIYSINSNKAFAEVANHIVISEVQIGGDVADDEFIELYNPSNEDVIMDSWRLSRKTSGGSRANLVTFLSATIPAHGYLLIAPSEYDGTPSADIIYSTSSNISATNTIILYSDAGITEVDKVGIGAGSFEPETSPVSVPPENNGSIERKACDSSTSTSMQGEDSSNGNSWDTDNNLRDFVLRDLSEPQNSSSAIEAPGCTDEPTGTPNPTQEPTPTDTPSPTGAPTPTDEPTPTQEPAPTDTPTPAPTRAPTFRRIIGYFPISRTICYIEYSRRFFFFPRITCERL